MRKLTIFSFCYCLSSILWAQKDSIPIGQVIYIQQVNLPSEIQNNGYATLLFNQNSPIYRHNSAPKRDSSFSSESFLQSTLSGDIEGFPIYKIHSARKMFCKIPCRRISREHCIVLDTFGAIDWMLHT